MSETNETHVHVMEDGSVVEHSHGEHGHHHSHAQTKAVLNRLSRAIGHTGIDQAHGGGRTGLFRGFD